MRLIPTLLLLATPLFAQGVYNNADKPGAPICPRIEATTAGLEAGNYDPSTTGGMTGANAGALAFHQQGQQTFAKGNRKDVSNFAIADAKGKLRSVAEARGKVLIIAFWGTQCDPSAKLLMELAELQPKGEKFGFEAWPVNFDGDRPGSDNPKGGWSRIIPFVNRNKKSLGETKLFVPGLGAQGPSNFMDVVESLPAFFVVDREGKLAYLAVGYTPNMAGDQLKRFLVEK